MGIEYLGVTNYPKHKKCEGTLLIIGSARGVWDDLSRTNMNVDAMAVNDMIVHYPKPLKHAYSNDIKRLPGLISARRPRYLMDWGYPIAHSCHAGWPWPGHGTSSLNAVYTGLALGYSEIILAGIPLDNSGYYFDPPWIKTNFENEVGMRDGELRFWANAARNVFDGKVKSLSGRTKELLDES